MFIAWIEANLGPRPAGMSIDRWPDNDGDYEPGNVRWATPTEQMRNTRCNRLLSLGDETQCVAEWAEDLGISADTIHDRLKLGWTAEQALSTAVPVHGARLLTLNGVTRSLTEWADHLGLYEKTIMDRLYRGWPVERALTPAGYYGG